MDEIDDKNCLSRQALRLATVRWSVLKNRLYFRSGTKKRAFRCPTRQKVPKPQNFFKKI